MKRTNMEEDMHNAGWFVLKVRESETYAQNLYAAMCNMQFQKLEVFPILKNERWSCSWRHAGSIVADLRDEGDYMNWYCSGMGGETGEYTFEEDPSVTFSYPLPGYVAEGTVTKEIRQDLRKLGWVPVPYED
jgi:hypothetical protein